MAMAQASPGVRVWGAYWLASNIVVSNGFIGPARNPMDSRSVTVMNM